MTRKVAVLLSGSGHRDGAEIHEATCTLLALDNAGIEYVGVAPNKNQTHVINHLDGSKMKEDRNIMVEAGRIMRGNVQDLSKVNAEQFGALIMPGGFGAALNYCNYGTAGRNCEIDKNVKEFVLDFVEKGKPVGAICIAPVVVAKALEGSDIHATLTIGDDRVTALDIESFGAIHKNCSVRDAVVDKINKIVTTPAYMLAKRIGEVNEGVGKLVEEIVKMM